jgi:hypothetical protein
MLMCPVHIHCGFVLSFQRWTNSSSKTFKNGHETRHFKSYRLTKSLGKNTKQRQLLAKINIGSKSLQDENVRIIQEKHRLNIKHDLNHHPDYQAELGFGENLPAIPLLLISLLCDVTLALLCAPNLFAPNQLWI